MNDVLLSGEVPSEIAQLAQKLSAYTSRHGYRDWQLMGVASRNFAFRCERLQDQIAVLRSACEGACQAAMNRLSNDNKRNIRPD